MTQAVVVLACGGRSNENWDPTDAKLAAITALVARDNEALKVYAQKEVANLLPKSVPVALQISEHRMPKCRLDTREVLLQIKEKCVNESDMDILLVVHPIHSWRAKKAAEKIGFRVTLVKTGKVPLDPLSKYPWVRSEFMFNLYEKFLSIPTYWLCRWI